MWRERFRSDSRTAAEEIPTEEALGRVTAAPVFAGISAPTYHASAMDGIAVSARQTYGATERHPRILEVGRNAQWVNTGQVIPEGCDSVIMVENGVRRLNEPGRRGSVLDTVREAAIEVRKPTMYGELIIAIVFLPVLALEGIEGKLFRPMALTLIFALAGSLILSLTPLAG